MLEVNGALALFIGRFLPHQKSNFVDFYDSATRLAFEAPSPSSEIGSADRCREPLMVALRNQLAMLLFLFMAAIHSFHGTPEEVVADG